MSWLRGMLVLVVVVSVALLIAPIAAAQVVVYPVADGTIADGFADSFDGDPDAWDWTFDMTSFEGSITLIFDNLDRRVVWEYDLSDVELTPPVSATLTFTIRGSTSVLGPDADVQIFSYPVDLAEDPADFSAEPAVLEGGVTVPPLQAPTVHTLNVSSVVGSALSTGTDAVAFRFQINPDTPDDFSQAFIDALDSAPATKPTLTIEEGSEPLVGDIDADGDVDLVDLDLFVSILLDGPPPEHPEYADRADLNGDTSIDGNDIQPFVNAILSPP